jgi:hypothetical protein
MLDVAVTLIVGVAAWAGTTPASWAAMATLPVRVAARVRAGPVILPRVAG